jgi:hypothetical protein
MKTQNKFLTKSSYMAKRFPNLADDLLLWFDMACVAPPKVCVLEHGPHCDSVEVVTEVGVSRRGLGRQGHCYPQKGINVLTGL